jgi:membrane protease YdiL (CAAX protease family)
LSYLGFTIPANAYAELVVHHVVQLCITIALIAVIIHWLHLETWKGFGFTMTRWKSSLRDAGAFVLAWTVIQFGVGWFLVSRGTVADPGFEMNVANLVGVYLFQLFLSGVGEEPLYRGLVLVSLCIAGRRVMQRKRLRMTVALLLSTAVFMFDHINFTIRPFSVTHFNALQQVTLLVFGVFYGLLFFKYRSLFGPIVTHGMLNVVIVSSGVLLSLVS